MPNRRRKRIKYSKAKDPPSGLDSMVDQNAPSFYTSKFKEVLDGQESSSNHANNDTPIIAKENTPKKLGQEDFPTIGLSESPGNIPLAENRVPPGTPTGPRSTYARIVRESRGQTDHKETADVSRRLAGPAPPPLRGFPNFPQSNPPNRNLGLVSGRLQNTNKLGNGATWGLGAVNGAPGLPSAPGRQNTATANTSFAQSIGGSQPATPLDLS
ncbi:MAG: hypothetical protein Q9219_002526 [cf. Caloplaca sp. 3 TL-2023]